MLYAHGALVHQVIDEVRITDGKDFPKRRGGKKRARHSRTPMDVTFLRSSARRTPSKYRRASPATTVQEEGVEEQASEGDEELQGNDDVDDVVAVVPITRAPTPLQEIAPGEEMPMYELVPGSTLADPAPYMSLENVPAIATGFVLMDAGAVSTELINADDKFND